MELQVLSDMSVYVIELKILKILIDHYIWERRQKISRDFSFDCWKQYNKQKSHVEVIS